MTRENFELIRTIVPRAALLTALILAPSAAWAGGHGGAGAAVGGTTGMSPGSFGTPGMGGQGHSNHQGGIQLVPSYDPAWWYHGGGWNGSDTNRINQLEQEMWLHRQRLQQFDEEQRLQKSKQAEPAESSTAKPNPGLAGFVAYDQVRWPIALKAGERLVATRKEAEALLMAVHKQSLSTGHAKEGLVTQAKEKLLALKNAAMKHGSIKRNDKVRLAEFMNNLDLALDRSLRRPERETPETPRERSPESEEKLANNP